MAYTPTNWKDRDVENPRTYTARQNEDGSITFFDAPGTINEAGTPVNAVNMNKIEEQLYKNDLERKITNCITEIPQDIKLELNNGTLTLKAGSKVYVPNGAGKFDEAVISADKTTTSTTNGVHFALYNYQDNVLGSSTIGVSSSGTTEPTEKYVGAYWYDTANNIIKRWNGSSWRICALPLGIITVSNGVITSIDQVFNGFGYIGNTVYALPGVKGLTPNGRNADGTLKNTEYTVDNVYIRTISAARTNGGLIISRDRIEITSWLGDLKSDPTSSFASFTRYYNTVNNVIRVYLNNMWTNSPVLFWLGSYYTSDSSGTITSFTPKLPFRAVNQNDFNKLDEEVAKLDEAVNTALRGSLMAYAGATAPTGWLKCDGSAVSRTTYSALFAIIGTTYGAGNGSTTFNLPNFVNRTFWGGTGAGQALSQTLPNITGTFKNGSRNELGLSGAMYYAGTNTSDGFNGRVDGGNDANWTTGDSVFDASRSNSVYQDGAVVRPNVIQTLICIKY